LDVVAVILIALVALLAGVALGALGGFVLAQRRSARLDAQQRDAFGVAATDALRANSETFLQLAREALGREQLVGANALKERATAIERLVEPLRVALERTEAQVQSLERDRRDAFAGLKVQLENLVGNNAQLQRETHSLVDALRRPEVRGRWGEMTLRRVVELAGMSEHCDFTEQLHIEGSDGALRPDLVVHLSDGRDLIIDVKTPLDAYLAAHEAQTDDERAQHLKRHAQQLETHVRKLASKAYWAQFRTSPQFVVLFLPGEQFLGAALTERPDLIDGALQKAVIIATPATLMAILKSVAHSWRQAVLAENAEKIRDIGQDLYRRLGNFTGHLGKLGKRLDDAVHGYNDAVGSLERQVLPQARRFVELGVSAEEPLPTLDPITQMARPAIGPTPAGPVPPAARDS
jgi:DNA recombination protein RmuC